MAVRLSRAIAVDVNRPRQIEVATRDMDDSPNPMENAAALGIEYSPR